MTGDAAGKFEETLSTQWKLYYKSICTNLRQVRLVMNDIAISGASIGSETYPPDLVGITVMRRFAPELYAFVYRNYIFLTNAGSSWKSEMYRTDETIKREGEQAAIEAKNVIQKCACPDALHALLGDLFPEYIKYSDPQSFHRVLRASKSDSDLDAQQKRVRHPDYFPIYFRYEVPETIISTRDFGIFLETIKNLGRYDEVLECLRKELQSLGKGTLRRYDFIDKLRIELETILIAKAMQIAYILCELSPEFVYDLFNVGEAARALAAVFIVAKRLENSKEILTFLVDCMSKTEDDTFAIRLLDFTTKGQNRNNIIDDFTHVDAEAMNVAFDVRMRKRYGYDIDASSIDLNSADSQAFNAWTLMGSEQHEMCRSFWERFVGLSRKNLARAISFLFMRFTFNEDPMPFVNRFFSTDYLRNAFEQLTDDGVETEAERGALLWLGRLLNGDFSNGVPMTMNE